MRLKEREPRIEDVRASRPRCSNDLIVDAFGLSRLESDAASRACARLRREDDTRGSEIIGLSAEIRTARILSAFVDRVDFAGDALDRKGVDLIVWLARDRFVQVQVKAGASVRRFESTGGIKTIVLSPSEPAREARRRLRREVDAWIDLELSSMTT